MTQKNNILQELQELNSKLAAHTPEMVYGVPAGYFDSLANTVLNRIRAMEAATANEELLILSPEVSGFSKKVPYAVPAGYFEELVSRVLRLIKASEAGSAREEIGHLSPLLSGLSKKMPYEMPAGYFDQLSPESIADENLSAKEELENLSPFLSGLKKEIPYSVPQGYFENIVAEKTAEEKKPAARVVSFGANRWLRYAAAAVVTGVIVMLGFILLNKDKVTADDDSYAWVKKNGEKLDELIQLTDMENSVAATDPKNKQEVSDLLKDVPEEEIQSLLDDTQTLDDNQTNDAGEDVLMN